ncbi:hypothetical protein FRB99_006069 [Tulasnella sp. 403]|nr:hypothetical protein FRB99_006069 [Tulasnella sp. 403]
MALSTHVTRVVFMERPAPDVNDKTFKVEKVSIAEVMPRQPNQVLVKVEFVSIDPAMRGWLDDRRSYIEPVQIGAIMRANAIGQVVKVHERYQGKLRIGDFVSGLLGWTEYALVDDATVHKFQPMPGTGIMEFLGPLGMTGLTAYFGMLDVAKVKAGETCVVSGAAGAVGNVACQIAKLKGAKVVAIAGSDDKCRWLEQELGVDKAINYKSPSFIADFKEHVGYLDVYFDNVGGDILDLCLGRLNKGARLAICGAISDYGRKPKGIQGYLNLISQRATMQGFLVMDYRPRFGEAVREMSQWMKEGKLKSKFHIEEGIERCPEYLKRLFEGVNTGKMVVRPSGLEPSRL